MTRGTLEGLSEVLATDGPMEVVAYIIRFPDVVEFEVVILLGRNWCEWVSWYPVACAVLYPLWPTRAGFEFDLLLNSGNSNLFLTPAPLVTDYLPGAWLSKLAFFWTLEAVRVKTLFERLDISLLLAVFMPGTDEAAPPFLML